MAAVAVFCLPSVLVLPVSGETVLNDPMDVSDIVARMERTSDFKRCHLQEFSVTRHYVLSSSHMSHPAEMTVRLTYRQGAGKSFEIIDDHGAEGMGRRILERVMQAEVESSKPQAADEGSLTPAHYDFVLLGSEQVGDRRCFVLELHPKKHSRYLIQGKAWVDAQDFAVVRLEGRPSANLSFWVGKPLIVQEFQKHGGFWMASHNRSLAETMLTGRSELTIDYDGYDLVRVSDSHVAAVRKPGKQISE